MKHSRNVFLKYKYTLLVILLIIVISIIHIPDNNNSMLNIEGLDSISHFVMYGLITFIILLERNRTNSISQQKEKQWAPSKEIIILVIMGGVIEIIQPFVAGRSCELEDFISNILGIATGQIVYFQLYLRNKLIQ